MRLMSDWAMARTEPTTMVTAASTTTKGAQSHVSGLKATMNTRSSAPKAATFVPALMKAVTHVGAPWYASGVHMWKGTAAILNANPTARSPAAPSASAAPPETLERDRANPDRFVVPVAPYARATP